MQTLLLVTLMVLTIALVGIILIQRSEGGALGVGGGGGGLMSARGAGNLLTRITAVLGACFFAINLVLAVIANQQRAPRSIVDDVTPTQSVPAVPATPQAPIRN
ncbi:MAG: preprotein translocase subunit SecG [Alphaproteobacteria bacterium]|nr:preprotein translocase subunit SecG [Alphaproteobacteria bacterium]